MSVLEFIKVVILGIVEGITEWLPISSTGHMILVDEFIKMDMSTEFKDFFLVVIQLGRSLRLLSCIGVSCGHFTYDRYPRRKRHRLHVRIHFLALC